PSSEPIERARIPGIDFVALLLGEPGRQRPEWIVKIPVRIVARKQDLVPADPVHHLDHMIRVLGFLHRLGRYPEMLAQIFRWRPAQMRDFILHAFPVLVEPPAKRRDPGKARSNKHDLELGITLEYPLDDKAR